MSLELTSAVVRILRSDGSIAGTGFVVSSDGLIATCAHVVQAADAKPGDQLRVIFNVGNAERTAEVPGSDRWHEQEDIVVVRITGELPTGVAPVKLGSTANCDGHDFRAFGYPLVGNIDGIWAKGKIEGLVSEAGHQLLQLNSQNLAQGMSGAPVLDDTYKCIVGMVSEVYHPDVSTKHRDTGFAIPAEALLKILQKQSPTLCLHPPQPIEDYLAAVREYCANLPYLTLHDIRPPKTLDEVYVPLKARPLPRKDASKSKGEKGSLEKEAFHAESLSIAEVMRQREVPHVLILGEPGAGKSTLLRQMAERAWDAPSTIGLSERYLPLLVPLRQLASASGALDERLSTVLKNEMALPRTLPDGFFDDWPQQTGAHWLIMLDALDEVPDSERAHLMQWLKGQLPHLLGQRVAITSRPTGYRNDFDPDVFSHYDLLSFTPAQTGEFAQKWFSDRAGAFLKDLDRIRTGDLLGTPLLLTIAAKVFGERNELPERRSRLYKEFISIWLQEARQRDEKHELSERLWNVAFLVLARLARAMTEQSERISEQALYQIAASYLREQLNFKRDEAGVQGQKLVQILARRSGVFTQRGDSYQFIHPTFREYLTAYVIVNDSHHPYWPVWQYRVWNQAVSRWQEGSWYEIALIVLSILSDSNLNVTLLLQDVKNPTLNFFVRRNIAASKDGKFLYFIGVALSEKALVDAAFAKSVIDALLAEARPVLVFWGRETKDALLALKIVGTMRHYVYAGDTLLLLAHDKRVDPAKRIYIAELLAEFRRSEVAPILAELARDKAVNISLCWHAAEALSRLKHNNDVMQTWLRLSCDERLDSWRRKQIQYRLNQFNYDDLAQAWLDLSHDENMGASARYIIAQALGNLELINDASNILLQLVLDKSVNAMIRVSAAKILGKLGQVDNAIALLLAMAEDQAMEIKARIESAKAIALLDQTHDSIAMLAEMLMGLVRDKHRVLMTRISAAKTLVDLGRGDDVFSLLSVLTGDNDAGARIDAAAILAELGHKDSASAILFAITLDNNLDNLTRESAAIHIIGLGLPKRWEEMDGTEDLAW